MKTKIINSILCLGLMASGFLFPSQALAQEEEPASFDWSLEFDAPVDADTAQSVLNTRLQKDQVVLDVQSSLSEPRVGLLSEQNISKVRLSSSANQGNLRTILWSDLEEQFLMLGGTSELEVSGEILAGEEVQIVLQSNPSTGALWAVEELNLLEEAEQTRFEGNDGLEGASQRQIFHFLAVGDGEALVRLKYTRSWLAEETTVSRIKVDYPAHLQSLDLSDPDTDAETTDLGIDEETQRVGQTAPELDLDEEEAASPVDYRYMMPPVRDQGYCGSCWAFGSVGVMEAAMIWAGKANPATIDLSEQFLVSCNKYDYGCDGGNWTAQNYHWFTLGKKQSTRGAVLESSMPYTSGWSGEDGTCKKVSRHPYKLLTWAFTSADMWNATTAQIKTALEHYGPVGASMCAGVNFSLYKSGILTGNDAAVCGGGTNHAVVIVGWDTDPDVGDYWIVRNSWGPSWGEAGYFRIKMGISSIGKKANVAVYGTPLDLRPKNDNRRYAVQITTTPFTDSRNTLYATRASNDPGFQVWCTVRNRLVRCVKKFSMTVWYKYKAPQTGTLTLNTSGSDYDTLLGVWNSSWRRLASSEDVDAENGNYTSSLSTRVIARHTYYIQVGAHRSMGLGNLVLNADWAP